MLIVSGGSRFQTVTTQVGVCVCTDACVELCVLVGTAVSYMGARGSESGWYFQSLRKYFPHLFHNELGRRNAD